MPVAVWLVRGEDGSWVLVDAGTFDNPRQRHATRLVEAVRAAIPAGERLVAIAREPASLCCVRLCRMGALIHGSAGPALLCWACPLQRRLRTAPASAQRPDPAPPTATPFAWPDAVTHGHVDHVGALPQLLTAFPAAPVLLHEREAAFLLEGRPYIPATHPLQRLYVWIGLAPAGFAASLQVGDGGAL